MAESEKKDGCCSNGNCTHGKELVVAVKDPKRRDGDGRFSTIVEKMGRNAEVFMRKIKRV